MLGAVALVLAGVVALSSGNWLARRDRFAVYFPGSVRGLDKGSPVTFRGVKVGEVHDVKALLTGRPEAPVQIEVVIEIQGSVVEIPEGQSVPPALAPSASREAFARELIERGIRARMMSAEPPHRPEVHRPRFPPQGTGSLRGAPPAIPRATHLAHVSGEAERPGGYVLRQAGGASPRGDAGRPAQGAAGSPGGAGVSRPPGRLRRRQPERPQSGVDPRPDGEDSPHRGRHAGSAAERDRPHRRRGPPDPP